ncbi:etoposide-induced protein 2.4-domain-containing protein, partial [Dimargaris cristalligena]
SLADYIRQQLWFVWAGVKDASAWPTSLIVVYGSKTIQQRVLKCVFLNGILFLGSILFYQVVLLRLNWYLLHILAYTIAFAYNAFWLYPVYCLSFLLNAIWYQEIADRVYSMRGGEPTHQPITYSGLLQSIASEIYRILLFFTYVVWASLIYLIPWVGPVASFIYFCWIYAFYCFEYQWINKNWSFEKRLDYLEGHWAYFLGFGLPCTLCTFFSTQFVSAGVFAFLFPMYIIMANIARPLPRRSDPTIQVRFLPDRLPIFKLSKTIN